MSYNHFIEGDMILTDFKRFCYDHNLPLSGRGAVELAQENYGVHSELIYRNGPALQIIAGPKVSEHLGLLEVARQLQPLLQYTDGATYTIKDEYGETMTVSKAG